MHAHSSWLPLIMPSTSSLPSGERITLRESKGRAEAGEGGESSGQRDSGGGRLHTPWHPVHRATPQRDVFKRGAAHRSMMYSVLSGLTTLYARVGWPMGGPRLLARR